MHAPDSVPPAASQPSRPAARGASLERKLPLLISALLLAVVVIYGWVTYDEVRRSAIAAVKDQMRIVARQLADLAQTSSAQRYATLRRTAAHPTIVGAVEGWGDAGVDSLLRSIVTSNDSTHEGSELWSADGQRRFISGVPATAEDLAQLRRVGQTVLETDSVRQTPFYVSRGRVLTWTVAPVHAAGRPVGYVAERRRVANSSAVEGRIRQLTGQAVTVLFTTRGSDTWAGLNGRPLTPPFDLRALGATFVAPAPGGGRLYGAQAAVAGTPYIIVLGVPEPAVLARPRAFLRRTLVAGVVVLLVGAVGAWLLSRRVTRPLRTLADAAGAIAAGDYRQRVAVHRGDELGTLGATFNVMAERIGESHAELARRVDQSAALTNELEGRNTDLRASQEATLRAVRRTQQLQSVTAALAGALEFDRVVQVIVSDGVHAADAASGQLFVVDPEGTTLTLIPTAAAGAADVSRERSDAPSVSLDAPGPLAEAARAGVPVFVPSADAAGVPVAALPLVARGRTIGALRLRFAPGVALDAETPAFLGALAQQCAQALDRALLYGAAVHARHAAEDARRAAQEASQAKSAFLAMMSHELRTPLNVIGGYTELLELGIRGPVTDAQREDLTRIQRNQRQLLSIIDDLLNLSRIEAGAVVVHTADVPVDAVLSELDALVAPLVAEKGIHYAVRGCDPRPAVRADPEKLKQVLVNLVSNAVRFTDAGGSVTVACEADDEVVSLRVADTGRGIPADKLDAIFEPFVQVDAGLTRRTGGTGLGLAISRDLMAAMGGRIAVESVVDEGSTFTLTLPRAGVGAGAARAEAGAGVSHVGPNGGM